MTTQQPENRKPTSDERAQPDEQREHEDKQEVEDKKLDEAIEMTFPASDPISI